MTTYRLNESGKDRVMNERGITTKVKNAVDDKVYWIATGPKPDGTYFTVVGPTRMFGMPPKKEMCEIFTPPTSEKECMEIHFALEEVVQKQPRDKWASSLPDARLAARKMIDEAERQGLFR